MDPVALAAQLGLPAQQVPPSWSALAALQGLDSSTDAALRQVRDVVTGDLPAPHAALKLPHGHVHLIHTAFSEWLIRCVLSCHACA